MEFKKGDKVKVLGLSAMGKNRIGDIGVVEYEIIAYHFVGVRMPDDVFLVMNPRNIKKMAENNSKEARIINEKVWVGDKKCRKILGFENVKAFEDLPEEYRTSDSHFYIGYSVGRISDNTNYTINGYKRQHTEPKTPYIVMATRNRGNMDEDFKLFYVGFVLKEEDYQWLVGEMRKAGERLAQINRANRDKAKKEEEKKREDARKKEWSGVDVTVI